MYQFTAHFINVNNDLLSLFLFFVHLMAHLLIDFVVYLLILTVSVLRTDETLSDCLCVSTE